MNFITDAKRFHLVLVYSLNGAVQFPLQVTWEIRVIKNKINFRSWFCYKDIPSVLAHTMDKVNVEYPSPGITCYLTLPWCVSVSEAYQNLQNEIYGVEITNILL